MSEKEVSKLAAILQQAGVSIFHFVAKTIPGKISFFWQDINSSAGLFFFSAAMLNFYD